MPRQITAFSNPTVKRLRSLRDKKARREEGLFLAEGLRIITEARDNGRLPEIIMFSAEGGRHPLASEIITATEADGGDAIETTADILSKTSGKDNPQMLVAAYKQPDTSLSAIDRSSAPLWFAAQALRDPGNIGTILRTGDAVGAGGLILIDDSADPYSVEAVRASMGAIFRASTGRFDDAPRPWIGLVPRGGKALDETVLGERATFVLGAEREGLPQDVAWSCDLLASIPLADSAESLNVAAAGAIALYERVRS